jgi:tRNA-specific 2-thiouridylase
LAETKSAVIAMSGGVDSSVAAYLMKSAGYRCMGATMRLYRNEDIGLSRLRTCCSQKDIDDAADVAFRLDIPFEVVDFTGDFKKQVIEKFIHIYETGGTPNPCIDCNQTMKFGALLDWAEANGYSNIVTGHYARVEKGKSGRWLLKKALDSGKDQSYVLYGLTQEQLSRTILPLGELTKSRVREIAAARGFPNSQKPDSQDICFVPDGDYVKFMEQYTGRRYPPGDFLNTAGEVIGRHNGAVRYTIGQRRGLGLSSGTPLYVCAKCMETGAVTVGGENDLLSRGLYAQNVNWVSVSRPDAPFRCTVKTRYRQTEQPAEACPDGSGVRIEFDEPQRAVAPGQSAVMYDGDTVVGGGTITEATGKTQ